MEGVVPYRIRLATTQEKDNQHTRGLVFLVLGSGGSYGHETLIAIFLRRPVSCPVDPPRLSCNTLKAGGTTFRDHIHAEG